MRFSHLAAMAACLCSCFSPRFAFADESAGAAPVAAAINQFNSGDIAWMLTSSALVLMMTAPGLALFYGGLVRKKNILGDQPWKIDVKFILDIKVDPIF